MKEDLTHEERKLIYNAVKYWQMHKTSFKGKDHQICENLLSRWFNDVYTQKQEQPT